MSSTFAFFRSSDGTALLLSAGVAGCRCATGVLVVVLSLMGHKANGDVVEQVRAIWKSREDMIKTFQYECKTEDVKLVPSEGGDDAFGPPRSTSKESITLRGHVTYSKSGRKLALKTSHEQWDNLNKERQKRAFRAAFNQTQQRTLLEGGSLAHGKMEDRDVAGAELLTNITIKPLLLSSSPRLALSASVYQLNGMSAGAVTEYHDGAECVRLRLPRKNKKWEGFVLADPARGYVPLKFTMVRFGTVNQDHTMTYVPEDSIGWVIAKWKSNFFRRPGELERSVSGHVIKFSINEPLDDSLFEIDFPVGAHVARRKGLEQDYYIQEADGLRKVSEDEMIRLRRERRNDSSNDITTDGRRFAPLMTISVVVTVGLLALFLERRRR